MQCLTACMPGNQAQTLSGAKAKLGSERPTLMQQMLRFHLALKELMFGTPTLLLCSLSAFSPIVFFRTEFSLLVWQVLVMKNHLGTLLRKSLREIKRNTSFGMLARGVGL